MKNILKTQPTIKQKFKLLPIIGVVGIGVVIAFTAFYLYIPKLSVASGSLQYPAMKFTNPVLISGVDGQVDAIYNFPEVVSGIDAHIKIVNFYNGASINTVDNSAGGYYDAWQPFIVSPTYSTSWVDWNVTFKIAGTNTDTVLTRLAATAIDVDGDAASLKEIVGAHRVFSYSAFAGVQVTVTYKNDSCIATSSIDNVANIDTTRTQAMFMKIFRNVSSINYRTGAENGGGVVQVRQNSIYFKYFDAMPTPLPVELISFKANKINQNHVQVKWNTASEKNNDFFTVERSRDGISFIEVQRVRGAGNSSIPKHYSIIDIYPFEGVNYYRLVQTDFDGTSETFRPTVVNLGTFNSSFDESRVISNPFVKNFKFIFTSEEDAMAQVNIIGLNGVSAFKDAVELKSGINEYYFANGEELRPGVYILRIQSGNKVVASHKVIKN